MKRLWYVIALMGVFFKSHALDEALKPVKQAIVRSDLPYMTSWLKNSGPLKPDDKKELLAAAEKWEKLRKTILTPFDRGKIYGGIGSIIAGVAPLLAYVRFPFLRVLVNRRGDGFMAYMLISSAWAGYMLLTGISLAFTGWNAGGTRIFENNAKAITQLLKKAPEVKPIEEPVAQETVKNEGASQ